MPRYRLTEAAKADVREIVEYLRERSPRAAVTVREELRVAMRRLAEFPHIGHFREDLTDQGLRFWRVYSYLIVYRAEPRPLQVLRVLHGASDIETTLREGE